MKEIRLKRKQRKAILSALVAADKAYRQGEPGAIMAQIWRDERTGEVFVDVEFIENQRAGKVYQIIQGRTPPAHYNWENGHRCRCAFEREVDHVSI